MALLRCAASPPLDELVHHAADERGPGPALGLAAQAFHGWAGHGLERGDGLAQEPPRFRGRDDRLSRFDRLLQALASLAGADVVADRETEYNFHALTSFLACAGYMSRNSRYRLMSGSDSITSASTAAMTTALISLLSILSTSFLSRF